MKNVERERGPGRGPDADGEALAGTRERLLTSLLQDGPATASGLAERLGLTAQAVRRHLDALLADGVVAAGEQPPYGPAHKRGRGRPARVYALTAAGREGFQHAYDDLAANALRYLAQVGGAEAVMEFARAQVSGLEERYRPVVDAVPPWERAKALAEALTEDGYAASVSPSPVGAGEQLCQHHCPVAHVAADFPQLCEAETEVFERLLGTHVQRLATISHGAHLCTTLVPRPSTERTA